jgi:hypothetical protein
MDSGWSRDAAARRLAAARSEWWRAARRLAATRRERWGAIISRRARVVPQGCRVSSSDGDTVADC